MSRFLNVPIPANEAAKFHRLVNGSSTLIKALDIKKDKLVDKVSWQNGMRRPILTALGKTDKREIR